MDSSDDPDFCENEKVAVIQGQSVKRVKTNARKKPRKLDSEKEKRLNLKKLQFQQNRIGTL